MTDKELWDAAWLEFTKTTDSYPIWVKKGKPPASHWTKGKALGDKIGVVTPPPPPPPPVNSKLAAPGQLNSVLVSCKSGDTVIAQKGNHGKWILNKSFAAPGVTVMCETGAIFAGVDTNSQSGYDLWNLVSTLPAEPDNIDVTPFYLHGGSERINLYGAFKLTGGYDAIKVYGGSKYCTFDDGGAASMLSGYGGDGIHVNQSTDLWIKSINIGNPWDLGPTPEHNDGIHAQAFTNLHIGPNVNIEALVTPRTPRSDVDSAGMFLRGEGTGANGLIIDGVAIHWQIGRGTQIIDINGTVQVHKFSIVDSGIPGDSPPLTVGAQSGMHYDFYPSLWTGDLSKASTYVNGAQYITWH